MNLLNNKLQIASQLVIIIGYRREKLCTTINVVVKTITILLSTDYLFNDSETDGNNNTEMK